jgi:lipopolysaccharide export LptBFGC system permease protein LptF
MLALPFALGQMRSAGQGARTVVGILIGAGYVLLSRTLESSGQIFDVAPWVVGWAPTIALAVLTGLMLTRAR